jgi:DNA-binding response OmpR family regulator
MTRPPNGGPPPDYDRRSQEGLKMEMTKVSRAKNTLLIVEDDVLPALALKDELGDAGYLVMELESHAAQALLAARAHKPDFALVNIELHGRDDGIELARDLKVLGIPVLFISGQTSRARSARTVAVGSLPKPYRTTDMVGAVDYLLCLLRGEETPAKPDGLEVFFETLDDDLTPKAA